MGVWVGLGEGLLTEGKSSIIYQNSPSQHSRLFIQRKQASKYYFLLLRHTPALGFVPEVSAPLMTDGRRRGQADSFGRGREAGRLGTLGSEGMKDLLLLSIQHSL